MPLAKIRKTANSLHVLVFRNCKIKPIINVQHEIESVKPKNIKFPVIWKKRVTDLQIKFIEFSKP